MTTIVGTTVAYLLVPMRSLGHDNWKIAAALMASYIGGSKFQPKVLHVNSNYRNWSLVKRLMRLSSSISSNEVVVTENMI